MRNKDGNYDFKAFGQAIKEARTIRGMIRDEIAKIIHIGLRYLTNIENKGQTPSLHVFHSIVTLFNTSVDQFFFLDTPPDKSTRRKQLDDMLDNLNDNYLTSMEATASGVSKVRGMAKSQSFE